MRKLDGFTNAIAKEVQFRTSGLAASYRDNINYVRRMQWEDTLNTFAANYAANCERFVDSTAATADYGPAEYLNTCFFTFFDPAVYLDGIANLEIRNLIFEVLTLY
jgi:hypothetical protein